MTRSCRSKALAAAVVAALLLVALGCVSPESNRTRGGGPGADVGNRNQTLVDLHPAKQSPYESTPLLAPPGVSR